MKIILILFLTLILSLGLSAQVNEGMQDIVYLKGGNIFRGVIQGNDDGMVQFISWSGLTYNFAETDILKIVQKPKVIKRGYNFKEKGIFNSTHFSILTGEDTWGTSVTKPSIENITGYQFNRLIGVGLGLGLDIYDPDDKKFIIPIFVQARGYVLKKKTTPFYKFDLGYGIPNKSSEYTRSRGGLMLHPAVGFRFGAGKDANFTMDFGYKVQRASYEYINPWESGKQEVVYRNYTVRIGVLF